MSSLLADESFQRWLSNKSFQNEREKWENWLDASPQNRELYREAQTIWKAAQYRQAELPNLNREWERLRMSLSFPPKSAETVEATRFYPRRSRRDSWVRFGAATFAFVILIVVMIRADFFRKPDATPPSPEYQVMTTEFGQRATIHLPEGITIILNANSSLRYPADWSGREVRNVELQGEAYFSVAPHEKPRPEFWVRTSDGVVKVVGTQFAVYERGSGTRVVVETGKVRVSAADPSSRDTDRDRDVLLQPGHLLQFQKDSHLLEPKMVSIHPYVTWWRDEMILENSSFKEIVQRLEETYDVEVRVNDPRLLERTLSGSIENQSLIIVTDALAKALRVSVKRDGRIILFKK